MTNEEAARLEPGLYRVYWSDGAAWEPGMTPEPGDFSVAAVGMDRQGRSWFAPTNWVNGAWYDWSRIKRVELITTQDAERKKALAGAGHPLKSVPAEVVKDLRETLAAVQKYLAEAKEYWDAPVPAVYSWQNPSTPAEDVKKMMERITGEIVGSSPLLANAEGVRIEPVSNPLLLLGRQLNRFLACLELPPQLWRLIQTLLAAPADFDFAAALADELETVMNVDGTPLRKLSPENGDVLVLRHKEGITTEETNRLQQKLHALVVGLRDAGKGRVIGFLAPEGTSLENASRIGMHSAGWVRAEEAYERAATADRLARQQEHAPMECGHPHACWEGSEDTGRCAACLNEALARAAGAEAEAVGRRTPPTRQCGNCHGRGRFDEGRIIDVLCENCRGTGRIAE